MEGGWEQIEGGKKKVEREGKYSIDDNKGMAGKTTQGERREVGGGRRSRRRSRRRIGEGAIVGVECESRMRCVARPHHRRRAGWRNLNFAGKWRNGHWNHIKKVCG